MPRAIPPSKIDKIASRLASIIEGNKRVGAKNTERFGALAQRFTWFGDGSICF